MNPRFQIRPGTPGESGSRLAANREIGDAPLCEHSWHDPGLDVAVSPGPSNADSGLPPPSFLNCQGPADGPGGIEEDGDSDAAAEMMADYGTDFSESDFGAVSDLVVFILTCLPSAGSGPSRPLNKE